MTLVIKREKFSPLIYIFKLNKKTFRSNKVKMTTLHKIKGKWIHRKSCFTEKFSLPAVVEEFFDSNM